MFFLCVCRIISSTKQTTAIETQLGQSLNNNGLSNSTTETKRTITSQLKSLHTKKNPRHMVLETHFLVWDRHTNVAGFNLLIGFQPS